jgi:hypothetical protein
VYLGNRDAGADGIAFVLQPLNTNLGGAGVGIGYAGISPSVTIEMDTWQNCDPAQDHVSIVLNGDVCHNASNTPAGPKTFSANVEDGLWHHVIFRWLADTKTLQFFWDDEATPFLELTKDIVATVFGGAYYVYPGFTSGTGAERNDHRVRVADVDFTSEGLSATLTPATCSNSTDGAIDLTVAGLTPPLTFLWSNGAATEDVGGLAPGNYKVTVTDSRVPAVSLLGSFDVGFAATATTWYKDADNDGFSDGTTELACLSSVGYKAAAALTALTGDCNDADATIYPGAAELCDTKDNDCDGETDEGCPTGPKTWYRDKDNDGYGNPNTPRIKIQVARPKGYIDNNLDCKDWISTVYPGAPELPDGLDNDCNGEVDEGLTCRELWYLDGDGDGYGRSTNTNTMRWSCVRPNNSYVKIGGDCNDKDASIYPGALEQEDGKDNDCNGVVDDELPCLKPWYLDGDGDGFGRNSTTTIRMSCVRPNSSYVEVGGDCKDNDPNVYPGNGCTTPPGGLIVKNTSPKAMVETTAGILVYPNPARDEIRVTLKGFEAGIKLEMNLVQADGKVVLGQSLTPFTKSQQVSLEVRKLNSGYYLLQVKQGSILQTKKVMIAK